MKNVILKLTAVLLTLIIMINALGTDSIANIRTSPNPPPDCEHCLGLPINGCDECRPPLPCVHCYGDYICRDCLETMPPPPCPNCRPNDNFVCRECRDDIEPECPSCAPEFGHICVNCAKTVEPPPPPPPPPERYGIGNVTGSGSLSINDALQILRFLVELPSSIRPAEGGRRGTPANEAWFAAAYADGSGRVTINSAIQVLRWLVNLPASYLNERWGTADNPIRLPPSGPRPPRPDNSHTIIQRPSPNYRPRRGPEEGPFHVPNMIVMHDTVGSKEAATNWIMNPAAEVSYHFIISPTGQITQFVDIRYWAFANGTNNDPNSRLYNGNASSRLVRERRVNANWYTVAIAFSDIEHGNLSDAQVNAAVWLMGHIRYEVFRAFGNTMLFNRDTVIGHNEIVNTACPGRDFPFERILELVNL